jgi:hypothetical protein
MLTTIATTAALGASAPSTVQAARRARKAPTSSTCRVARSAPRGGMLPRRSRTVAFLAPRVPRPDRCWARRAALRATEARDRSPCRYTARIARAARRRRRALRTAPSAPWAFTPTSRVFLPALPAPRVARRVRAKAKLRALSVSKATRRASPASSPAIAARAAASRRARDLSPAVFVREADSRTLRGQFHARTARRVGRRPSPARLRAETVRQVELKRRRDPRLVGNALQAGTSRREGARLVSRAKPEKPEAGLGRPRAHFVAPASTAMLKRAAARSARTRGGPKRGRAFALCARRATSWTKQQTRALNV